jgi:hypothetical protein
MWDPALPPGGLDRIFQQYDAIRSHATEDEGPPWEPEEDSVQPETPQTQEAPARDLRPTAEAPARDLRPKGDLPDRSPQAMTDATQERPKGRPKSWADDRAQRATQLLEQNLQKSRAATEQQNATIEQRLHEGHADKLLRDRENKRQGVTFAEDEKGMDNAYGYRSFPGASYDENTGTLYIAGSDSWRSWYDDFVNIPIWGDLKNSERYKQAERAYNDLTQKYGKTVNRVVGHSLGGSVALELAKNKDIEFSRTFGAPVTDPNPYHRGAADRYRHLGDPVSLSDRGASLGRLMLYPHSYTGFKEIYDEPAPHLIGVKRSTDVKTSQKTLTG